MTMFVRADRLLDGTGADPIADAVVEIADGRIVAIHQGGAPDVADAEVLEFKGATILPGLIDTHVHLNLPGDGTLIEEAMRESPGVLVATAVGAAGKALGAGITTVRDVGAYQTTSFDVRRAVELGYATGATVVACGQPITITGGHTWPLGGEADGIEPLRRKVRQLIKDGAQFIKVMGSGGGTVGTASWRPAFTQAELDAIVDEAHRNERKLTIHCLCPEAIDQAIRAGVDQIEHAGFIVNPAGEQRYDPAVGERLGKSGIPVTATLAVGATLVNVLRDKADRTPAEDKMYDRWQRMVADNLAQYTQLAEAGVRHVAGTDAGWRYASFDSLPLEMEMMSFGGTSAAQVIAAATGFAAEVIGIADRTGTLAPGLDADIIVVDGNPLDSLDALRDVRFILQKGKRQVPAGRAGMTPAATSFSLP